MTARLRLPLTILFSSLLGCSPQARGSRGNPDSAFDQVQHRGHVAMGVDQYTSTHHFVSTADGGVVSLQRDANDTAGIRQIRHHMGEIAAAFRRGDFAVPGFVHDRPVPGTATMAARRDLISYRPDTIPRGGELRISSNDSAAVAAIHEFLAFQRQDHRTGDAAGPQ
jgi:hypothetical protein